MVISLSFKRQYWYNLTYFLVCLCTYVFALINYISFQGFDHHVRHEHNMWSYIFFFIHLNGTKVNDYTALEMFVHKLVSLYSPNGQYHKISEYDQDMCKSQTTDQSQDQNEETLKYRQKDKSLETRRQ